MPNEDKFKNLPQPPAPMFMGEKERALVKHINQELEERVIGQQIVYYPIDRERTNYHAIYGEAIDKVFLPPVRVFALVEWEGKVVSSDSGLSADTMDKITVNFHNKRLNEDQKLEVTIGDFVLYGQTLYEIMILTTDRQLFGDINQKFQTAAECLRSRLGIMDVRVL